MRPNDPGFDVLLSEDEIASLMGCPPRDLELASAAPLRLLVTGAGGSIGRALTLSLLSHGHKVTALDRSEKGLFLLLQECAEWSDTIRPEVLVQDLGDYERLASLLTHGSFDAVIHAAAYKHVGFMEANQKECFRNNVGHTIELFRQAESARVARFVFLSTDKAVEATSIMGQSKAEAELALTLAAANGKMSLAILRLPNVLGSDGSVVQIFRRQACLGRPFTVTDSQAARLFVAPQSASHFVESAVTNDLQGVLVPTDFIELNIVELADRCHQLWGICPTYEIAITGLGAGEKLRESLIASHEILVPSPLKGTHLVQTKCSTTHEN